MRCGAPYCKNTADDGDASAALKGISFHAFPSEVGLRAAWLRALGKQDSLLPDSAVVCSQHFLDDDICETESGLRQLATGAVPSMVQVCMICLDSDSRLFLMSKHKMEEAYEKLTGYPPYDVGNLKQTLCTQCAQRLRTFRKFRDKSLRARAIMMDLVEKHELITRQHIKMINRTKNQLDNNFVVSTLGPDPCDLYIQEHPSEEQQTDSKVTLQTVEVKKEGGYDSMLVDEDTAGVNDDSNAEYVNDEFVASKYLNETKDPLKYEGALFQCALCYEEFESKPAYEQHMGMHGQAGAGDGERAASPACEARTAASSSCPDTSLRARHGRPVRTARRAQQRADLEQPAVSPFLAMNTGHKVQAEEADAVQRRPQVFIINNGDLDTQSFDIDSITKINRLTNRVVTNVVYLRNKPLVTQRVVGPTAAQRHIDTCSRDLNCKEASQNEDIETVVNKENVNNRSFPKTLQNEHCSSNYQVTLPSETNFSNTDINDSSSFIGNIKFTCGVCSNTFERKSLLVKHVKTHTVMKSFTCKFCKIKFKYKSFLTNHLRIHTGEKLYCCDLCKYKCARKGHLVSHVKTHTGEKPYSCKLCKYKCTQSNSLMIHMRTHTGEKPYSCELCKYKCSQIGSLVVHMRTHTGEKPYSCEFCKYKSARSSNLVSHMKTHTGEKPYSCELCEFKCALKNDLVRHMKTHTGEKPYCCLICKRKFVQKSHLVRHRKTHTGDENSHW